MHIVINIIHAILSYRSFWIYPVGIETRQMSRVFSLYPFISHENCGNALSPTVTNGTYPKLPILITV